MHKPPRIHPEFKALIPPLSQDEYNQLEQNILANGCRDPIVLWRDIIIDGHNRHEICTKHGLEYETIKLRFPSRDAAKLWVLDNQLGRRNITDAVRIELAQRKVALMGLTEKLNLNIARAAGLSERTVQRYMRIKTIGGPEMLEKVLSGQLAIGTAHRISAGDPCIDVTTITRESMGAHEQTPEERRFVIRQSLLGNAGHIEALYVLLTEHRSYCAGIAADVNKWLDLQYKRLERLVVNKE